MRQPKLIILRGPSGSGKSTAAKMLFDSATKRTVLIEQDHYRFIFNPPGGGTKPNVDTIHKMIRSNVLTALEDGYDVILEGILSVRSFGGVLEDIFAVHPTENYMFYFDISLEETLRRHATRPDKVKLFGEKEMREWYPAAHKSGHPLEQIIPESSSIEEILLFVKKTATI